MGTKTFWLEVAVLLTTVSVGVMGSCTSLCQEQGSVSVGYCAAEYVQNPSQARECCLVSELCPAADCTDWIDMSPLAGIYNISLIAEDYSAQTCDCDVVDCIVGDFNGCTSCTP